MTESHADFAVLGSTPLARLLAGILAAVHGKRVVFVGESQASYRLPRGIDLSVSAVTRPETWALLGRGVPETTKLLTRVGGRRAWSRVDPVMFSEAPAGRVALAHVRHMAQAFGHAAERARNQNTGRDREGLILRDAVLLHRPMLETVLDKWLGRLAVRRVGDGDILTLHADGSGHVLAGDERIVIRQTVLADDAAVLAHLDKSSWPGLLHQRIRSTISIEPTAPIAAPVMLGLDNGIALVQQAGKGLSAMGPGAMDPLASALGQLLGTEGAFRQAGQSSYQALVTADGAPAVGRVGGNGPDVLAGLGPSAAFLAPAIARWLCGVAEPAESAWFGARLVDRQFDASPVAEFGGAQ